MSKINTGGPAFPVTSDNHADKWCGQGMTLRDYFAAKAMQGMLAAMENYTTDDLSTYAYQVADVMLKAREVGHD